ncbi:MAG: ribonucleoside-diphosphate reductase subunit alpha [Burkholderiales bacterium]|nr:ribonucleoside-diphosphate reductase subunit alpha [Burkholderiales bacterium]
MNGSEAAKTTAIPQARTGGMKAERPKLALVRKVEVDRSRDALLTDFGKTTLEDRYLLPGESYQDMFARVSTAFADDADHAQRVYDYMSQLWFMPSTPVLSNGGAERGLPISCFLNAVDDSLDGILGVWNENVWLAANGGGIGTYWGGVRSIGEKVKGQGQTSGIIPLHHGISITDEFMHAVRDGHKFGLRSPKTNEVLREVDARALWQKVLELRLQTGEPYLIFSDTVNRAMPQHQRELGLKVRQSNLCSEIMLHTGVDHLGNDRTAVCCLSSVNAETFLEWRDHPMFIEDIMRFLDNVLQDFIDRAPDAASTAAYAAMRERSVGLGLMGFHSFLQSQNVPFESALAKSWNMRMFKHLRREADKASVAIGQEKGPCPDAAERGSLERFSHKLAIAPTASISIICGGTSAGIEPIPANIYTHKTLSGSFAVKNPYLERLLEEKGQNTDAVWGSILENEGSVQHLDFLSQDDKDVYKTAFELDQRWVVELAADRTPEVCQSQSVNIFLPGDVDKWDLHMLHWQAWERGVKSLYYLRSKSVQRASYAGSDVAVVGPLNGFDAPSKTDYEECLACQ